MCCKIDLHVWLSVVELNVIDCCQSKLITTAKLIGLCCREENVHKMLQKMLDDYLGVEWQYWEWLCRYYCRLLLGLEEKCKTRFT